jgi:hypothetical protein
MSHTDTTAPRHSGTHPEYTASAIERAVQAAWKQADVYRVTDLRGNTATWTGERVAIPEEAVLGYRARKLSKFKSVLLVGAIALAIVFSLGQSLDLFGDELAERPDGGPQQS